MKQIIFDFTCSRQVPFYAHLCNEYLNKHALNISIGQEGNRYFIEAEGVQADLEKLADEIAADFLISIWLTDSKIELIEQKQGQKTPLSHAPLNQAFCAKCFPLFADNQSSQFGDINLACSCHGQDTLSGDSKGLTLHDMQALVAKLQLEGEVAFNGMRLSLNPSASENERNKVLVCNPNTLNAHFVVKDHQVLALSSIEKPLITARSIYEHTQLSAPLYDLCFAYDRVLAVVAELLRQKGVDWVYYTAEKARPRLAWVEGGWSELHAPIAESSTFSTKQEPLHDDAIFANLKATWNKGEVSFKQVEKQASMIARSAAATCALHGANAEANLSKNTAIIYLSKKFPGQIVTLNGKKETELFFALPELPATGYDIYHQLEQSPQRALLEKFKTKFPDDYMRLLDLKLDGPTDNLQSLWAIAGLLLGLPCEALTKNALSDALVASAMSHKGANAPRIDYPLTKGEAHRSLNWCKTLGTVMSFRLADDSDPSKIAFGMQDSLADFISNWMEHVDQNVGVKTIMLAGSEFSNEVLARRLSLRLGVNFSLKVNRQLSIDGNNLATGALYLKQRRR